MQRISLESIGFFGSAQNSLLPSERIERDGGVPIFDQAVQQSLPLHAVERNEFAIQTIEEAFCAVVRRGHELLLTPATRLTYLGGSIPLTGNLGHMGRYVAIVWHGRGPLDDLDAVEAEKF